jgi:hypothetical protein
MNRYKIKHQTMLEKWNDYSNKMINNYILIIYIMKKNSQKVEFQPTYYDDSD